MSMIEMQWTLADPKDAVADEHRDKRDGEKLRSFTPRMPLGAKCPDPIEGIIRDAAEHKADREIQPERQCRKLLQQRIGY